MCDELLIKMILQSQQDEDVNKYFVVKVQYHKCCLQEEPHKDNHLGLLSSREPV